MRESIENYLEECSCSLCGSNDKELEGKAKDYYNHFSGEFSYYKCKECGFVFTNPRPIEKHISKFYPDDAGYLTPKEVKKIPTKSIKCLNLYFNYLPSSKIKKIISYPWLSIRLRKLKIQSFPNFVTNGKLLDIGASYGDYLFKMKSLGWKTKGIELNQNSVNYATNKLGLDVENILIEEYTPDEKFDVINMGMVMEHILLPNDVTRKVISLLKDKGTFIFSIPNYGGLESKIFRKYWYSLHVPMHLNHFTPKTVSRLLNNNGFKNIKIYHQNDYNDFIRSIKYLSIDYPLFKIVHTLLNIKVIRKLVIAPIFFLLALLGFTSRMTIYAKI